MLGINQPHLGPAGDINGYIQLLRGTYSSEKPINITAFDNIRLKCDCNNGSIVNALQEPIFFTLRFNKPPGHKIYKDHRIKLFKKKNKTVIFHVRFDIEDDD